MNHITCLIIFRDELVSSKYSEIIEDIWVLNCRGNQDGSKLQIFWDATYLVIETDTGAGAHL